MISLMCGPPTPDAPIFSCSDINASSLFFCFLVSSNKYAFPGAEFTKSSIKADTLTLFIFFDPLHSIKALITNSFVLSFALILPPPCSFNTSLKHYSFFLCFMQIAICIKKINKRNI